MLHYLCVALRSFALPNISTYSDFAYLNRTVCNFNRSIQLQIFHLIPNNNEENQKHKAK